MKYRFFAVVCRPLKAVALACVIAAGANSLYAQTPVGNAIYYSRGDMKIGSSLLNGTYDIRFKLFDAATGGNQVGPIVTRLAVAVSDGKMPAQALDFGAGAFDGEARWIEVKARQGANNYALIGDRQRFRPAPYALALPGFFTVVNSDLTVNVVGGSLVNMAASGIVAATISGGGTTEYPNSVEADYATVSGGYGNKATAYGATVGGGWLNTASGVGAVIPGGTRSYATGSGSFAAGSFAYAVHNGAFVWADDSFESTYSSAANQFTARAKGGVRFITSTIGFPNPTPIGVQLAPGGTSWSVMSDRNVKENFSPVDVADILQRVACLPITRWNLVSQDESITHIGPMAQDFHAAFGVGEDNTHITTIDADGVALAAIQGLHQIITEKDKLIAEHQAQIGEQRRQLEDLSIRLTLLEAAIPATTSSKGTEE